MEEWVEYLKNGVISPDTQAPGLQEAREKLKYYSMSDAERYAYDEHINAIMIQNDVLGNARLEGMEEGRAEEKNNIALAEINAFVIHAHLHMIMLRLCVGHFTTPCQSRRQDRYKLRSSGTVRPRPRLPAHRL